MSQSLLGFDFCESDSNIMVTLPGIQSGDGDKVGAYSINNGKTWQFFEGDGFSDPYLYNSKYYYGGAIMIDPNNCSIITIVPLSNIPYVSYNFTYGPWYASTGAPSDVSGKAGWWFYYNHCINDRINGKYIYLYDGTKNIYISDNYGLNFTQSTFSFTWNPSLSGISEDYFTGYIQIDYQKEGRLCVCQGINGLWCSNDHGWTFNQYDNVRACRLVGFGPTDSELTGINKTDSNYDATRSIMYFFGISKIDYTNGERSEGMYYINGTSSSNDSCIKFNNNSYQLGNQPQSMTVDRTTPGRVYVGSSGNGVQFSTFIAPTNSLNPTTIPTEIPTQTPSKNPTDTPTGQPTLLPSSLPSLYPSFNPTNEPSTHPASPSAVPTDNPTVIPSYVYTTSFLSTTEKTTTDATDLTLMSTTDMGYDVSNTAGGSGAGGEEEEESSSSGSGEGNSSILIIVIFCAIILGVGLIGGVVYVLINKGNIGAKGWRKGNGIGTGQKNGVQVPAQSRGGSPQPPTTHPTNTFDQTGSIQIDA